MCLPQEWPQRWIFPSEMDPKSRAKAPGIDLYLRDCPKNCPEALGMDFYLRDCPRSRPEAPGMSLYLRNGPHGYPKATGMDLSLRDGLPRVVPRPQGWAFTSGLVLRCLFGLLRLLLRCGLPSVQAVSFMEQGSVYFFKKIPYLRAIIHDPWGLAPFLPSAGPRGSVQELHPYFYPSQLSPGLQQLLLRLCRALSQLSPGSPCSHPPPPPTTPQSPPVATWQVVLMIFPLNSAAFRFTPALLSILKPRSCILALQ